ncbi:MAG: hypothetical protein CM15mV42_2020 [uncultured marine virus]|nr:MAG: hypothetical protein CM15mV42_2020 [uncultured marine virus]
MVHLSDTIIITSNLNIMRTIIDKISDTITNSYVVSISIIMGWSIGLTMLASYLTQQL